MTVKQFREFMDKGGREVAQKAMHEEAEREMSMHTDEEWEKISEAIEAGQYSFPD